VLFGQPLLQRSASVGKSALPTAVQAERVGHETECSRLLWAGFGVG